MYVYIYIVGTSEKMQLGGLVGIFQTVKMALG